jgi:PAS domain S-box-containing protein
VRLWNAGAERIFGFRADEIVGKSMDLIIPENLRERHWEGYNQAMETGRTQYSRNLLAVPAIRKDGTRISIEFTIALIRDGNGNLLGPAAILRDVTARWNQDKELRKRLATLETQVGRLTWCYKNLSIGREGKRHGNRGLGGMLANMCVESRLRQLMEQGFEVAVAKDAAVAPKHPEWGYGYTAALINFAFLAHAVLTTDETVKAMEHGS